MPKLTIASLERSAISLVFRQYADPGAFMGNNPLAGHAATPEMYENRDDAAL